MMPEQSELDRFAGALESVRESLRADNADLEVLGLDGTVGRAKLVLGPETCQECILPREFLELMMLMNVQEVLPRVTRVELDDPRHE